MFKNETYKLIVPKDCNEKHIPKEFDFIHVCKNTFLIQGDNDSVRNFTNSPNCEEFRDCNYPISPWRTEYKYLGDHPKGEDLTFDLRLKNDHGYQYQLNSELPPGLIFSDGILSGSAKNSTPIVDILLKALHLKNNTSQQRRFQVRFFDGCNHARSFLDKDYIHIGYGPNMIDYDPNLIYYRNFSLSDIRALSPMEEAKIAAQKIATAANGKEIQLFVSGGIDSQCMVQSFVLANVPFQAVLMVDKNGVNSDDVHFSRLFFKKKNLPLKEIEVDYISYIKNYEYIDLAMAYRFNNPEYGILLSLMKERPNIFPVYAGRPISVSMNEEKTHQVVGLAVDETWSRSRFLERERREGCPEFLIYTPELMLSCLETNYAKKLPLGQKWNYDDKVKLLESAGFDIDLAPPEKYTGFEKMSEFFKEDSMGNDIWLHHRGPLKLRFKNAKLRNAIPINPGEQLYDQELLKSYEDGFSYQYLHKYDIKKYH